MSKYIIVLTKKAQKQLDKLPDQIVNQIIEALSLLEDNPRPSGCKKLNLREGYRIRTGAYRIIYDILDQELLIDVIALGHRKEVYE